jgi:hypothetical protein
MQLVFGLNAFSVKPKLEPLVKDTAFLLNVNPRTKALATVTIFLDTPAVNTAQRYYSMTLHVTGM